MDLKHFHSLINELIYFDKRILVHIHKLEKTKAMYNNMYLSFIEKPLISDAQSQTPPNHEPFRELYTKISDLIECLKNVNLSNLTLRNAVIDFLEYIDRTSSGEEFSAIQDRLSVCLSELKTSYSSTTQVGDVCADIYSFIADMSWTITSECEDFHKELLECRYDIEKLSVLYSRTVEDLLESLSCQKQKLSECRYEIKQSSEPYSGTAEELERLSRQKQKLLECRYEIKQSSEPYSGTTKQIKNSSCQEQKKCMVSGVHIASVAAATVVPPKKSLLNIFAKKFRKNHNQRAINPKTDVPIDIKHSCHEKTKHLFAEETNEYQSNNNSVQPLEIDHVQISAVVQDKVEPGSYFSVDILMYEEEFRKIVDAKFNENIDNKEIHSGYHLVERNSKVKIILHSKDIELSACEERIWTGKYLNFNFVAMLPEDYTKKQILFCATVYINDIIATKLNFFIDCNATVNQEINIERDDILSAFISYASQDRNRVAAIIQGMKKARPDMDIFFDIESLRSGQRWEDALKKEIDNRDVLFLCWSKFAKSSKWVEQEWRYALENKGEDCIEPIPIDPPELCPPPIELQQKHFNDKMVYIIKATYPLSENKVCLIRKNNNEKIFIDTTKFYIGRLYDQVNYTIDNIHISKVHAYIVSEAGEYFVVDNNSTNKTYVNGIECIGQEKMKLEHGAIIKFADEEFVFNIS